jgi:hypothetical protein
MLSGNTTIGAESYIGAQAYVEDSTLGRGVYVEPGAILIGASVPAGSYVAAGTVHTPRQPVSAFPLIEPGYFGIARDEEARFVVESFAAIYGNPPQEPPRRVPKEKPAPVSQPAPAPAPSEKPAPVASAWYDPLLSEEGILGGALVLVVLGTLAFGVRESFGGSKKPKD